MNKLINDQTKNAVFAIELLERNVNEDCSSWKITLSCGITINDNNCYYYLPAGEVFEVESGYDDSNEEVADYVYSRGIASTVKKFELNNYVLELA